MEENDNDDDDDDTHISSRQQTANTKDSKHSHTQRDTTHTENNFASPGAINKK